MSPPRMPRCVSAPAGRGSAHGHRGLRSKRGQMSPEAVLLALRLALALALYAFLALILLYLWRDVRASATAAGAVPQAYLELVGPPVPGKAFALLPVNLLGRAAGNTLVLDENTVSAHHARLSYQQGQWGVGG